MTFLLVFSVVVFGVPWAGALATPKPTNVYAPRGSWQFLAVVGSGLLDTTSAIAVATYLRGGKGVVRRGSQVRPSPERSDA